MRHLPLLAWSLPVSLTGLVEGLLRSSRVLTVILAAQVVQLASDPATLVRGLRGLGVPRFLAFGIDLVLDALGPRAAGRKRGRRRGKRGRPGGRRRDAGDGDGGVDYRGLLRGDLGVVGERIGGLLRDAAGRARTLGLPPDLARDVAVLVGLVVLAMSLRFLRVVPGLPVAPGHKGILLIPLYLLSWKLTRSRWGATRYGLLLGVTSFALGMGKFGPFDILRHLTPGVFVDLAMPVATRLRRRPGALTWAFVGMGAAATRISTLAAIAVLVGAPAVFYAVLVPTVVAHLVFGFASGFVTRALLGLVEGWERDLDEGSEDPAEARGASSASPSAGAAGAVDTSGEGR